ncbi:MAG TPA: calcium-binding EGF-like domain-containing protein [Bacteroidia bacterium]|nr:calcium-binding EGF-like domain-containing protein [Sphingobacteriales bacterium]HPD64383.1 calcium-binding EGF-like domain-containing protein [Bacteroidia bacterium]HRU66979.1 calcium-binding EGF-like domain-containing protein [Bacteroidia bacterium]
MKNIGYFLVVLIGIFTFVAIQNCGKDKCEGIVCLHGGTCVDGTCNCKQGYTGDLCQAEIKPKAVKITKFKVLGWPGNNGGNPWDNNDGPDIYVKIMQGTTEVYKHHKSEYNVPEDKVFELVPLAAYIPSLDPDKQYVIQIWDYDEDEGKNDQKMQETTAFKPYTSGEQFPATKIVKSFLWDLQIELTLQYEW